MLRLVNRNRNISKIIGLKWNGINMRSEINVSKDKDQFEKLEKILKDPNVVMKIMKARIGEYDEDIFKKSVMDNVGLIWRDVHEVDKKIDKLDRSMVSNNVFTTIWLMCVVLLCYIKNEN